MDRWTRGAAAVLLPFAFLAAAEKEPPGSPAKVSGRITATARDGGTVRAATLTTANGQVFSLEMDERGQSLAKVMHGQTADILGVSSDKGNTKWLRVLSYADERDTAAHEYWRRMRCLACVVLPATRNAAVPADLHGAAPLGGRFFSLKRRFTAWARDAKYLWVAQDNAVLQVDLAEPRVLRSLGRKEGLPDRLVYQLLSDGKTLWIVHRGGVAALKIGEERVRDLPRLKAAFARAFADPEGVWIIADTGTYRLKDPGGEPAVHPPLPTAGRIRKVVEDGIWGPHWARRTAHLVTAPAAIGGRLYVGSYGDLYELAGGRWERIVDGGWEPAASRGKLWFVDSGGLKAYDPATKQIAAWEPPEAVRGRYRQLLVTDAGAWLAAQPSAGPRRGPPVGGGLARFDLATQKWDAWPRIHGRPTNSSACLTAQDDGIWAVTMDGEYGAKSAHPGMTTTTRLEFKATGFALHRWSEKAGQWDSFPLPAPDLEKRLICGQDGQRSMDTIVPQSIEDLSVGATRIFAVARLAPKEYFGGYWPCVEQVASRPGRAGRPWAGAFAHHPAAVGLQGEQPLVLNISSGELTRIGSSLKDQLWEAVGHDLVLALFRSDGRHWAVTEGCVAWFDEAGGAWHRLAEPEFRWYWRATAALDDGRWLYIGSDRGLVCRLDLETGRFECLTALKERAIARIAKGKDGSVFVVGRQAPLGVLPVPLRDVLKPMDCDAARFDGKTWAPVRPEEVPPAAPGPRWFFRLFERKDHLDKSEGNYLCGPAPGDPQPKPRYYVQEVFYPLFLCTSPDGGRIWVSTYTGILRLDVRGAH